MDEINVSKDSSAVHFDELDGMPIKKVSGQMPNTFNGSENSLLSGTVFVKA